MKINEIKLINDKWKKRKLIIFLPSKHQMFLQRKKWDKFLVALAVRAANTVVEKVVNRVKRRLSAHSRVTVGYIIS